MWHQARPGFAPVRIRLTPERSVIVPSCRPDPGTGQRLADPAPTAPAVHASPVEPPPQALPRRAHAPAAPGRAVVIALVEAAPAGAEELALTILRLAAESGWRPGVVALDQQNRLGRRLGCAAPTPAWCWGKGAEGVVRQDGARVVVAGPDSEQEVGEAGISTVLGIAAQACDVLIVDLGCRWEPRLFRPVLTRAERIWLLAPASKSTAMEMRLEQAEFSGWTDLSRVQPVLLTDRGTPGMISFRNAALIDDPAGPGARELVLRELRRLLLG